MTQKVLFEIYETKQKILREMSENEQKILFDLRMGERLRDENQFLSVKDDRNCLFRNRLEILFQMKIL
jgi:hypothetical protein